MKKLRLFSIMLLIALCVPQTLSSQAFLRLNDKGYLHSQGLDVTFFSDFYPDGHQTGVTIIQHGTRVAAAGDLRLEPSPGQWSPQPDGDDVVVDEASSKLSKKLWYPNEKRDRKGFNPIIYPDFNFHYTLSVEPAMGEGFIITVDLDKPLPAEWVGKVGFNFELFPGELFGKSWMMDDKTGIFNTQPYGPLVASDTAFISQALAVGKKLVVAPEDPYRRIVIDGMGSDIILFDGRTNHNNGWFIMRSLIPAGATKKAIQWKVDPNVVPGWKSDPVIQVSQLGYHPKQKKMAIIELDATDMEINEFKIFRQTATGKKRVESGLPKAWGNFLRYKYVNVDFTAIEEPGIYTIAYGDKTSHPFQISETVFNENTWQPTLEYYLPVQMCHMRVNEKYRVWHDICHMDDALMAPADHVHFDGYAQGPDLLSSYESGEPVPGLAEGGWHDAGDYDLRVESQAGTVKMLSWMVEEFRVDLDATLIDQEKKLVEIHVPDGKSDMLQQVEHGLLTILGGYHNLGRLYRGIICQDLRQYVMLGDAASMTDNLVYDPSLGENEKTGTTSGVNDDRWVFTEDNPGRVFRVIPGLAAASRVLTDYNPVLAKDALDVAEALWEAYKDSEEGGRGRGGSSKGASLAELYLATEDAKYMDAIIGMEEDIVNSIESYGVSLGRVIHLVDDDSFKSKVSEAVKEYQARLAKQQAEDSPYGVPYKPSIWGAGWSIQAFGMNQYFFYKGWPEHTPTDYFENALHFVLGVHPGSNNDSFVSGVGSESVTTAYGVNRADWSYIPGGVASGTALIRPDLPELKEWPFFWQQTEYVMGGGATNYMFLVLAVNSLYQ